MTILFTFQIHIFPLLGKISVFTENNFIFILKLFTYSNSLHHKLHCGLEHHRAALQWICGCRLGPTAGHPFQGNTIWGN
jgi:hypothetical protein